MRRFLISRPHAREGEPPPQIHEDSRFSLRFSIPELCEMMGWQKPSYLTLRSFDARLNEVKVEVTPAVSQTPDTQVINIRRAGRRPSIVRAGTPKYRSGKTGLHSSYAARTDSTGRYSTPGRLIATYVLDFSNRAPAGLSKPALNILSQNCSYPLRSTVGGARQCKDKS